MKDYYDLYYIANNFDFDGSVLTEALRKTFANRERSFTLEQFNQVMSFCRWMRSCRRNGKLLSAKSILRQDDYSIVLKAIRK